MEYLAHTEEGFALHYNPNSDAMHWKYIRKYISSKGKWVYVYDDSKNKLSRLQKKQSDLDKANRQYIEQKRQMRKQDDLKRAKEQLDVIPDGIENVERWYDDNYGVSSKEGYYQNRNYMSSPYGPDAERERALKNAEYELSQYEKTLKGKVDSFIQQLGPKLASSLTSVSDKISSGKDFLKKLKK